MKARMVLKSVIAAALSVGMASAAAQAEQKDDLLRQAEGLCTDSLECGVWLPLRTQPTGSTGTGQHSTCISATNLAMADKILAGLKAKRPMRLVRGAFGRVVISADDGLIQGMQPRILSGSFQGSYLREWAKDWEPKGSLKVTRQTADEIVLDWAGGDASRRITVFADGRIETSWHNGPREVALFTGAFPYHYLATDGATAVRFSQLLQARRELAGLSSFALFGYRDAALEVKARGLKSRAEEIWLDPGEIGWQWVQAYVKEHPGETRFEGAFGDWMRQNAAFTYMTGGAVRKIECAIEVPDYELSYRLSTDGPTVMQRIASPDFPAPPPAQPAAPVRVTAKDSRLWTVRTWPNHFNGWELRPLNLVPINPMPRFYELTLTNRADGPRTFTFDLKKAGWMASARIESDPTPFCLTPNNAKLTSNEYRQQPFWKDGAPALAVEPNAAKTALLAVQPVEETLGDYDLELRWKAGDAAGALPLRLRVVLSSLVDPYAGAGIADEDYRYFGSTGWGGTHPLYFEWYYRNLDRAGQDRLLDLFGQECLRKGWYLRDIAFLREYITAYTQNGQGASREQQPYFSLPPDEFVKRLRDDLVMRKAQFPYRYRVYMYDEIFEILGGYKGRRYMPVDEVARWTRDLIMDCPNPCYPSYMQQCVDAEYQTKLPNDIAELFYYCGRDEVFQSYVRKLVEPRMKLFERWKNDPACMRRAGAESPRPLFSFWISGQLHVTTYPAMRRQHWFSRFNGIDIIMFWRLHTGGMLYADRIGCNSLLSAGAGQSFMTDRSLAWYDLRQDMAWISLVRFLKEKASPAVKVQVSDLEKQAYAASQENRFDEARDALFRAVTLMAPEYAGVPGPHFFAPVKATPLPDLTKEDELHGPVAKRRLVTVRRLPAGGHRPPPVLDGVLDNSYLENGAHLDDFRRLNTFAAPKEPTDVYLAWDDGKLYILFICGEHLMDKIKADPALPRDGPVYSTDCVEVFLDRSGQGKAFMQFVVGAGGAIYDASGGDVKWNPEYGWKVARSDAAWSAELHIPWSEIGGKPGNGDVLRMNFGRERYAAHELSMWSPQSDGFGLPEQFGSVRFTE